MRLKSRTGELGCERFASVSYGMYSQEADARKDYTRPGFLRLAPVTGLANPADGPNLWCLGAHPDFLRGASRFTGVRFSFIARGVSDRSAQDPNRNSAARRRVWQRSGKRQSEQRARR